MYKSIENIYDFIDEMRDILTDVSFNMEELEGDIQYLNDKDYINIDELITMLENGNLITDELSDYLNKLKFRR